MTAPSTERYRIVGATGNTDWFVRDWKEMCDFINNNLLYAVEELEVGATLNIRIDRIEISDAELDELIPEES